MTTLSYYMLATVLSILSRFQIIIMYIIQYEYLFFKKFQSTLYSVYMIIKFRHLPCWPNLIWTCTIIKFFNQITISSWLNQPCIYKYWLLRIFQILRVAQVYIQYFQGCYCTIPAQHRSTHIYMQFFPYHITIYNCDKCADLDAHERFKMQAFIKEMTIT